MNRIRGVQRGGQMGHMPPPTHLGGCTAPPQKNAPPQLIWGGGKILKKKINRFEI